ncbi:Toxin B [BD1-7 clade bacterium]|uniref:Toxin B n=1 Tax=BD1-7 clade bacterium TaxID=2029982 RepID=A0A5S9QHY3_9GAMM|nr:Toxin B [BD1-7 clade bacterium]
MDRIQLFGCTPRFENAQFAIIGGSQHIVGTGQASRRAVVIAHSEGDTESEGSGFPACFFRIPESYVSVQHLAPAGHRLLSSNVLFTLLENVKGFDSVRGGEQSPDIELWPVALDEYQDLAALHPADNLEYDLILLKQPMSLSALVQKDSIHTQYNQLDLHVCRNGELDSPSYYLDVPQLPLEQHKSIEWRSFGVGKNGAKVSNDTGFTHEGTKDFVQYANEYVTELSAAISYYRDPNNRGKLTTGDLEQFNKINDYANGQLHHFAEEIAIGRQTGLFEPDLIKRLNTFKSTVEGGLASEDGKPVDLSLFATEKEAPPVPSVDIQARHEGLLGAVNAAYSAYDSLNDDQKQYAADNLGFNERDGRAIGDAYRMDASNSESLGHAEHVTYEQLNKLDRVFAGLSQVDNPEIHLNNAAQKISDYTSELTPRQQLERLQEPGFEVVAVGPSHDGEVYYNAGKSQNYEHAVETNVTGLILGYNGDKAQVSTSLDLINSGFSNGSQARTKGFAQDVYVASTLANQNTSRATELYGTDQDGFVLGVSEDHSASNAVSTLDTVKDGEVRSLVTSTIDGTRSRSVQIGEIHGQLQNVIAQSSFATATDSGREKSNELKIRLNDDDAVVFSSGVQQDVADGTGVYGVISAGEQSRRVPPIGWSSENTYRSSAGLPPRLLSTFDEQQPHSSFNFDYAKFASEGLPDLPTKSSHFRSYSDVFEFLSDAHNRAVTATSALDAMKSFQGVSGAPDSGVTSGLTNKALNKTLTAEKDFFVSNKEALGEALVYATYLETSNPTLSKGLTTDDVVSRLKSAVSAATQEFQPIAEKGKTKNADGSIYQGVSKTNTEHYGEALSETVVNKARDVFGSSVSGGSKAFKQKLTGELKTIDYNGIERATQRPASLSRPEGEFQLADYNPESIHAVNEFARGLGVTTEDDPITIPSKEVIAGLVGKYFDEVDKATAPSAAAGDTDAAGTVVERGVQFESSSVLLEATNKAIGRLEGNEGGTELFVNGLLDYFKNNSDTALSPESQRAAAQVTDTLRLLKDAESINGTEVHLGDATRARISEELGIAANDSQTLHINDASVIDGNVTYFTGGHEAVLNGAIPVFDGATSVDGYDKIKLNNGDVLYRSKKSGAESFQVSSELNERVSLLFNDRTDFTGQDFDFAVDYQRAVGPKLDGPAYDEDVAGLVSHKLGELRDHLVQNLQDANARASYDHALNKTGDFVNSVKQVGDPEQLEQVYKALGDQYGQGQYEGHIQDVNWLQSDSVSASPEQLNASLDYFERRAELRPEIRVGRRPDAYDNRALLKDIATKYRQIGTALETSKETDQANILSTYDALVDRTKALLDQPNYRDNKVDFLEDLNSRFADTTLFKETLEGQFSFSSEDIEKLKADIANDTDPGVNLGRYDSLNSQRDPREAAAFLTSLRETPEAVRNQSLDIASDPLQVADSYFEKLNETTAFLNQQHTSQFDPAAIGIKEKNPRYTLDFPPDELVSRIVRGAENALISDSITGHDASSFVEALLKFVDTAGSDAIANTTTDGSNPLEGINHEFFDTESTGAPVAENLKQLGIIKFIDQIESINGNKLNLSPELREAWANQRAKVGGTTVTDQNAPTIDTIKLEKNADGSNRIVYLDESDNALNPTTTPIIDGDTRAPGYITVGLEDGRTTLINFADSKQRFNVSEKAKSSIDWLSSDSTVSDPQTVDFAFDYERAALESGQSRITQGKFVDRVATKIKSLVANGDESSTTLQALLEKTSDYAQSSEPARLRVVDALSDAFNGDTKSLFSEVDANSNNLRAELRQVFPELNPDLKTQTDAFKGFAEHIGEKDFGDFVEKGSLEAYSRTIDAYRQLVSKGNENHTLSSAEQQRIITGFDDAIRSLAESGVDTSVPVQALADFVGTLPIGDREASRLLPHALSETESIEGHTLLVSDKARKALADVASGDISSGRGVNYLNQISVNGNDIDVYSKASSEIVLRDAPKVISGQTPEGFSRFSLKDGGFALVPKGGQGDAFVYSPELTRQIDSLASASASDTPDILKSSFDYYRALSQEPGSGYTSSDFNQQLSKRMADLVKSEGVKGNNFGALRDKTYGYLENLQQNNPEGYESALRSIDAEFNLPGHQQDYYKTFGGVLLSEVKKHLQANHGRLTGLEKKAVENIIAISEDAGLPRDPSQILDRFKGENELAAFKESLSTEKYGELVSHLDLLKSLQNVGDDEKLVLSEFDDALTDRPTDQSKSQTSADLLRSISNDAPETFEELPDALVEKIGELIKRTSGQSDKLDSDVIGHVISAEHGLDESTRAGYQTILKDGYRPPKDGIATSTTSTTPNQSDSSSPIVAGGEDSTATKVPTITDPTGGSIEDAFGKDPVSGSADDVANKPLTDNPTAAAEPGDTNTRTATVGEIDRTFGSDSEFFRRAVNDAISARDDAATRSAYQYKRGEEVARRFDDAVTNIREENGLGDRYVPILSETRKVKSGGYEVTFVDRATQKLKTITTEDSGISDAAKLIDDTIEERLKTSSVEGNANEVSNESVSRLLEHGEVEGSGVSTLNSAFAIQAAFSYFQHKDLEGDASSSHLADVLKAHEYVNLARVGYGVALDGVHVVQLVNSIAKSGETAAEETLRAGSTAVGAVAETAAGALDGVFGLVSTGFDIYELTQAHTDREKAIVGVQLGFDAGTVVLGGISTGLSIASVAGSAAIASTAAAAGAVLGGVGVIFAGVGIGIGALVSVYSEVEADAAHVGELFDGWGQTYKQGGFTYDSKHKALKPVGDGVIDNLDLNTGVVTFGDQTIYQSHHGKTGSGKQNYFFWSGDMPEEDRSKAPLKIRETWGYAKTHNLGDVAKNADIVYLPIGVQTSTIGYEYNTLPGQLTQHKKGFDFLRDLEKYKTFDYDFVVAVPEYGIDTVNFNYEKHNVKVELGTKDRTIAVPDIPSPFVGKLSYSLYGQGAQYTISLNNHANLDTAQRGDKASTYIIDSSHVSSQTTKITDGAVVVGNSSVWFHDRGTANVLISSYYDGDLFKPDFAHHKEIAVLVNGETLNKDKTGSSGNARSDLQTHLDHLGQQGKLGEFTQISNYHSPDGHVEPVIIYRPSDHDYLKILGKSGDDVLLVDREKNTIVKLNKMFTEQHGEYQLPGIEGKHEITGVNGDNGLVVQVEQTTADGQKAKLLFNYEDKHFVLHGISGDSALIDALKQDPANSLTTIRDRFAGPVSIAPWLSVRDTADHVAPVNIRTSDGLVFQPNTDQNLDSLSVITPGVVANSQVATGYSTNLHGSVYFVDSTPYSLAQARSEITGHQASATYDISSLNFSESDTKSSHTLGDFLGTNAVASGDGNHNHDKAVHTIQGQVYLTKGDHQLIFDHDDGFQLTLGGRQVFKSDSWNAKDDGATFHAESDGFYKLDILYYEGAGASKLRLNIDGKDLNNTDFAGPNAALSKNLLVNGSFEDFVNTDPTYAPDPTQPFNHAYGEAAGWHGNQGKNGEKVRLFEDPYQFGPAAEGKNKLYAGAGTDTWQDVKLKAGQKYVITFKTAPMLVGSEGDFDVLWEGKKVSSVHVDSQSLFKPTESYTDEDKEIALEANKKWVEHRIEVTATGDSSRLEFKGTSKYSFIDDVELVHGSMDDYNAVHGNADATLNGPVLLYDTKAKSIFRQDDLKSKPEKLIVGQSGSIDINQTVDIAYNTSKGLAAETHDGLSWIFNKLGEDRLTDVRADWISHHEDWLTDIDTLFKEQIGAPSLSQLASGDNVVRISGLSADADKKPILAFYDSVDKKLVIANTPGNTDDFSLLKVDSTGNNAWLLDLKTKHVYSQKIVSEDKIRASFDGSVLTSNVHREDTTHYVPHAVELFGGSKVTDLEYVDDTLKVTTAEGLVVDVTATKQTLVGLTDAWTAKHGHDLPDGYTPKNGVAIYAGGTDKTSINGWVFTDHENTFFAADKLPDSENRQLLGFNYARNQAYVTAFDKDPFKQTLYTVSPDGSVTKGDNFELAKVFEKEGKKTLLLKSSDGEHDVSVPVVDDVSYLLLSGGEGKDTFTVNNDALRQYKHIALDSFEENGTDKPDVVVFKGVVDANAFQATVSDGDVFLIDKKSARSFEFDNVVDPETDKVIDDVTIRSLGLPDLKVSDVVKSLLDKQTAGNVAERVKHAANDSVNLGNIYLKKLEASSADTHDSDSKSTSKNDKAETATPTESDVNKLVQAMASMKSQDDAELKDDRHKDEGSLGSITDDPHAH